MRSLFDQPVDWDQIQREKHRAPSVVDSRVRLRACLAVFAFFLLVVFGRVVQLELTQGAAFRRAAAEPVVQRQPVSAVRGRILSRDGEVLARDKPAVSLAVRYRSLESPPDRRWLRSTARSRLSRRERGDPERLAAEERAVEREHELLQERLASLCGLDREEWRRRAAEIQTRVERIAQSVNRRRQEQYERRRRESREPETLFDRWFGPEEEGPPEPVVVREQVECHVMARDVPPSVVAEIEGRPHLYPGTRIERHTRRDYPAKTLAAHIVGYLGVADDVGRSDGGDEPYRPGDRMGRDGLEARYESRLRGRSGQRIETFDRGGRMLASRWATPPRDGDDLVLTLDSRLQRTAESLLDESLARRAVLGAKPERAGAAAVVLDVRDGAILAVASAPRFDPNVFADRDSFAITELLDDPDRRLFHRAVQMALAPGSVFKIVSAVALLESGAVKPDESVYCRGYLERPEAMRCQIYTQFQRGHGEVRLVDALAESCNVYFFQNAGRVGVERLTDWAGRFEFGRPTDVDLPGEATGCVPTPETIGSLEGHDWTVDDTRRMAVGQGSLTATPLQIARMAAAVANGGRLVTPHVVARIESAGDRDGESAASATKDRLTADVPPSRPIEGLHRATLETIHEGLRMAVESSRGTARETVLNEQVAIAGKTGTAQTGGDRSDHAWFAGYLPADKPKYAVVVVLEHAGGGGEVAGPVVRRLALRMRQLGLLDEN
ncbi:MAG: hypothetical protein GX621_18620 [Pirellulaceae bacterium]|nr:hypothetical protein [Pirellulaceae bacterium]